MIINLNTKLAFLAIIFSTFSVQSYGHINPERKGNKNVNPEDRKLELRMNDCTEPIAQIEQNINNVRARLTSGGDVWWDPQSQEGKYIVPAVPVGSGLEEKSSIFAAAVWLGGYDPSDNLKLAATDYRSQNSLDFYTGPIDEETGTTSIDTCKQWDRFFEVEGLDIKKAIRDYESSIISNEPYEVESIPEGVRYWPGADNPYFIEKYQFALPSTAAGLGDFWDEDEDGVYDPTKGDFPVIFIRGCEPTNRKTAKELVPDEMIFWIYNDVGNTHTLSRGNQIGMEVQVQSFAYSTNDAINSMTFQRYKLINRATTDLRDCYFGWWVDPDLGCFTDDYSGCDVSRSLAYTYNEDILDGSPGTCDCDQGVPTYCDRIPMIGTDYFRGPLGPHDIVDCSVGFEHVIGIADEVFADGYELGDTICIALVDPESLEIPDIKIELGMSSYITYNNPGIGDNPPGTQDPNIDQSYYNYLQGRWNDGTPLTRGGNGYNPASTEVTRYAFDGAPDDPNGWSMAQEALPFGDRRTVQASGPFLLKPGDRNELIIGAVWVPDVTHPFPSLAKLQAADDVAQNLFDTCFDIIDGPDAPDMCTIELDREIILVLSNDSISSNNAFEQYEELGALTPSTLPEEERLYKFEGYKIYQLANAGVSAQELGDIEKSMLVAQVDVRNGVGPIFNWSSDKDPTPGGTDLFWTPSLMVDGSDEGINYTFRITKDAFASGDDRLVNHKTYYYMVVAYAYNNFEQFDQRNPEITQQKPYLEGRQNVKVYSATPRPIIYQLPQAEYGEGVPITRISGVGVGGNNVDMNPEMYDKILAAYTFQAGGRDGFEVSGSYQGNVDYKEGAGPFDVRIYNPLEVRDGKFELELIGSHADEECSLETGVRWVLRDLNTGEEIYSEQTIDALNEQLVVQYGFSITIGQGQEPGNPLADPTNGAISVTLDYSNPDSDRWFNAIVDRVGDRSLQELGVESSVFNFLRTDDTEAQNSLDPNQVYSALGDGYFYPFSLTFGNRPDGTDLLPYYISPALDQGRQLFISDPQSGVGLDQLNNVDLVFTSDREKWSKCMVVETANDGYSSTGEQASNSEGMLSIRNDESVDKDGNPLGDGTTGYGWFPGYAVDVETGKRLNVFFGENTVFSSNGRDMLFNPTEQLFDLRQTGISNPLFLFAGGGHYIYVTQEEYDGCKAMHDYIQRESFFNPTEALKSVTWCSMAYLQPGESLLPIEDNLIPNDLIVKLRVNNPYKLETEWVFNDPGACQLVENAANPKYQFEISGKQVQDLTQEEYEGALAEVNVVPNPYYAYSSYENSKFDNTVKITNVPDRAEITIFSLDGKFIKSFSRSERIGFKSGSNPGVLTSQTNPAVVWDMKNSAGIPIAAGVYLIHVYAPELGEERTIKWFGINRQFDASGL